jgi:hypothetical protein
MSGYWLQKSNCYATNHTVGKEFLGQWMPTRVHELCQATIDHIEIFLQEAMRKICDCASKMPDFELVHGHIVGGSFLRRQKVSISRIVAGKLVEQLFSVEGFFFETSLIQYGQ